MRFCARDAGLNNELLGVFPFTDVSFGFLLPQICMSLSFRKNFRKSLRTVFQKAFRKLSESVSEESSEKKQKIFPGVF